MKVLSRVPMPLRSCTQATTRAYTLAITDRKVTRLLAIRLPFESLPWLKHAEIASKLFDVSP
jgi:hypothetical protein